MKKIFLIEDDSEQISMYKIAFEIAGFKFIFSYNGKAGIPRIKKEKPDLILLDLLLDHDSGIEVLKKLKADIQMKNIPVIILTNFSQKEMINQGLKLGAKEALIKTDITPKDLVDIVKKYI